MFKRDQIAISNFNSLTPQLKIQLGGLMFLNLKKINEHALPITITKIKGGAVFNFGFLLMFHNRFASTV